MSSLAAVVRAAAAQDVRKPRLLGVFAPWRLHAYGYTLAAIYGAMFIGMYSYGVWLVDKIGRPMPLCDFTYWWVGAKAALHGQAALLYHREQLTGLLETLVGPEHTRGLFPYQNWPYPPTYLLLLTPFGLLPYALAFLVWEGLALFGCILVVYLIVRRWSVIPVLLASPFGFFDFRWGQTGFLRTALLGAGLLMLPQRPMLSGVFFGGLTFKPQFGILIPIALLAGREWRALGAAALTSLFLAGLSSAAFGIASWQSFADQILAQAGDVLGSGKASWGAVQTTYGLVRTLHGSAAMAWAGQCCVIAAAAVLVWLGWRSVLRYSLKAATLSAATLVATPYQWGHDLTVMAIPIAFLAADQMEHGLLVGEQTLLLVLFGTALGFLATGGDSPLGSIIAIALLGLITRRAVVCNWLRGDLVPRLQGRPADVEP